MIKKYLLNVAISGGMFNILVSKFSRSLEEATQTERLQLLCAIAVEKRP
jgi:hypothetical protein